MAEDSLGELRAKILTESLETSNEPKFGYFGSPGPLCIGDNSAAPVAVRKPKTEDGEGEPIRNIVTNPIKKGSGPDAFFTFAPPLCIDDPYVDPLSLQRKGKVTMLDPEASFKPPGKMKYPPLAYEYVPHMDGVKDPVEVREMHKDVMPLRQIYTNPAKKGGSGVITPGVLFGHDPERRFPEHVPDDYDAAKKLRKQELDEHLSKMQEMPFKGMEYGNRTFQPSSEVFHCDQPTHIPRDPPEDKVTPYPHENAFKPGNPMKRGMLQGLMGGFPPHMDDPLPEPAPRKPKDDGAPEPPPAFKLGFCAKNPKPTPSVTCNTRNMRRERPSCFARPSL